MAQIITMKTATLLVIAFLESLRAQITIQQMVSKSAIQSKGPSGVWIIIGPMVVPQVIVLTEC